MRFIRFEELRVFQLAEKLADNIWKIVCQWENFNKDIKDIFSNTSLDLISLSDS